MYQCGTKPASLRAEREARYEFPRQFMGKVWVWATGRPAVVTLLRGVYLWNGTPDWRAVFSITCHHPFYSVCHQNENTSVPVTACATCRVSGVQIVPSRINKEWLNQLCFFALIMHGMYVHVRTCAPVSISRERLGRLGWNLGWARNLLHRGLRIPALWYICTCARAHSVWAPSLFPLFAPARF